LKPYFCESIAYGPEEHPFIRGIRELFVLWFKMLIPMEQRKDPMLLKKEESWSQIYVKMSEGRNSITLEKCMSTTDGLASQVVVMLYGLGWVPFTYNKWPDPDECEWILSNYPTEPFPVMTIIRKIIHSFHETQIEKQVSTMMCTHLEKVKEILHGIWFRVKINHSETRNSTQNCQF